MTVEQFLFVLKDLPPDTSVYVTDLAASEVYEVWSIDVQHPFDVDNEELCVNIRLKD